jgi:hypothetical protein
MSYDKQAWDIEQQILGICYNMESINWSDAWSMTHAQRERTIKFINKRIEEHNEQMK